MSQQANPRGTFLAVADAIKADIVANPYMSELPRLRDVTGRFNVSRGVALRAFNALRQQGLAEPVPGARWRVVRQEESRDRRPLPERLVEVITQDNLEVGEPFPSASSLAERFSVSRPTVAKALNRLEVAGLLSEARQGKPRTVLALPEQEERAQA